MQILSVFLALFLPTPQVAQLGVVPILDLGGQRIVATIQKPDAKAKRGHQPTALDEFKQICVHKKDYRKLSDLLKVVQLAI